MTDEQLLIGFAILLGVGIALNIIVVLIVDKIKNNDD
jgi:hypothetical protein